MHKMNEDTRQEDRTIEKNKQTNKKKNTEQNTQYQRPREIVIQNFSSHILLEEEK